MTVIFFACSFMDAFLVISKYTNVALVFVLIFRIVSIYLILFYHNHVFF